MRSIVLQTAQQFVSGHYPRFALGVRVLSKLVTGDPAKHPHASHKKDFGSEGSDGLLLSTPTSCGSMAFEAVLPVRHHSRR
jgi:hypothetical protein